MYDKVTFQGDYDDEDYFDGDDSGSLTVAIGGLDDDEDDYCWRKGARLIIENVGAESNKCSFFWDELQFSHNYNPDFILLY